MHIFNHLLLVISQPTLLEHSVSDWSANRKSEAHFTLLLLQAACRWVIRSLQQCGQDLALVTHSIQISSMIVKDQIVLIWDGKHMYMYTSGGRQANILVWFRAWV